MRSGSCLCGAVRFTVHGEPEHVGRCHCADCRKESGSTFTISEIGFFMAGYWEMKLDLQPAAGAADRVTYAICVPQ